MKRILPLIAACLTCSADSYLVKWSRPADVPLASGYVLSWTSVTSNTVVRASRMFPLGTTNSVLTLDGSATNTAQCFVFCTVMTNLSIALDIVPVATTLEWRATQ